MNNTDKEKLIKSLQNIIDSGWGSVEIDSDTVKDIIAMLKEQEDALEQMRLDNTDLRNCNAELLKEQEAQRDYEASVDMAEYCERYEQTYNPEDGSM